MTETTPAPESVKEPMMLPRLPARRPSKDDLLKYQKKMIEFANRMQQLQAKIPRKVSSRGWCYIMEGMRVINKGEFDLVEKAINDCRKEGLLPLDFVDADESRKFHNREEIVIKTKTAREYLVDYLEFLKDIDKHKDDVAYWQNQEYYIEMMVEKKDLLNLFKDTCEKYHVSIANAKGWSDLISRGQLARRFQQAEKLGLKPVLLYFGDFDIGGLLIADQLKSNMKDIEKATGYDPEGLTIDHFGLSFDFINTYKLTWIDGKDFVSGSGKAPDKTKRHVQEYIAKYGERKCEANAVLGIHEPNVIALLEATIQKYLKNPFDVYDNAIKKTRAEVTDLMATHDMKRVIKDWIDALKQDENQKAIEKKKNDDDDDTGFIFGEDDTFSKLEEW